MKAKCPLHNITEKQENKLFNCLFEEIKQYIHKHKEKGNE